MFRKTKERMSLRKSVVHLTAAEPIPLAAPNQDGSINSKLDKASNQKDTMRALTKTKPTEPSFARNRLNNNTASESDSQSTPNQRNFSESETSSSNSPENDNCDSVSSSSSVEAAVISPSSDSDGNLKCCSNLPEDKPSQSQSFENFSLVKKVSNQFLMQRKPSSQAQKKPKHPPPGCQTKTFIFQRMSKGDHVKTEQRHVQGRRHGVRKISNGDQRRNVQVHLKDESNRQRRRQLCPISFRRALRSAIFAASIPLPPHNRRNWPYLKFKADSAEEPATFLNT